MSYSVEVTNFADSYDELADMYEAHYHEIYDREGEDYPPYNPRIDEYVALGNLGSLLTFVIRTEHGQAIGYCNVFLNLDMYNQQLIAMEDTIYIQPDSRGGAGKALGQCILAHLEAIGVKRFTISVLDKSGVAETCRKAGFKDVATQMVYKF